MIREDGSGRRDSYNFALCTAENFLRRLLEPGLCCRDLVRSLQRVSEGVQETPLTGAEELPYAVATESIPAGGTAEVLHIALGFTEDRFARVDRLDPWPFDDPHLGLGL